MAGILTFRRNDVIRRINTFLKENPGIKWMRYIPIQETPIRYLEIGAHKGDNMVVVSKSYCRHPDSLIYCIDPWEDYDEYPEYKNRQESIFNMFKQNIQGFEEKCRVIRGFSNIELPKFEDEFFDIIYIDGNHETEYVYNDAVMSLQKVKIGGYIIFDDYLKYVWDSVVEGVEMFVKEYESQIQIIAKPTDCGYRYGHCPQVIVKRVA